MQVCAVLYIRRFVAGPPDVFDELLSMAPR
jgi:hypothetical protein